MINDIERKEGGDTSAEIRGGGAGSVRALADLLARVEAAVGPDASIDSDVCFALGYCQNFVPRPPITRSLDCALAMAASLRPGWGLDCDATYPEAGIDWTLHEPTHPTDITKTSRTFTGTADSHALALLAAVLKAKIAEAGQ